MNMKLVWLDELGLQKLHRNYTHRSSAWKKSTFRLMNLIWVLSSTLYVPPVLFLRHCGNKSSIFCIDLEIARDSSASSWGPCWQVEARCQVHQLYCSCANVGMCHGVLSLRPCLGWGLLHHSRPEQSFLEAVD